jgi:phosphate transport system permease protein
LIADRVAGWLVTGGGLAIIASILGILLFILIEVWPLTGDARVEVSGDVVAPGQDRPVPMAAAAVDEHRTHLVGLGTDGLVRTVRIEDGATVGTVDVLARALETGPARAGDAGEGGGEPSPPAERPRVTDVALASGEGEKVLTAALSDGRILAVPVRFRVRFDGQQRRVEPRVGEPVLFDLIPDGTAEDPAPATAPFTAWTARLAEDGGGAAAAQLQDGRLSLVRRSVRESFLSGEVEETVRRSTVPVSYRLSAVTLDGRISDLYAGTPGGELLWWTIGRDGPESLQVVSAGSSGISALSLLIGDRSLVVGQDSGELSIWFPVEPERGEGGERLTRIRGFPAQPGSILRIEPSPRNKSFLAVGAGGRLGLYHSTSGRTLWEGNAPIGDAADARSTEAPGLTFAPKADAAYLIGRDRVSELTIDSPHPETTWKTLFGKVWYEGYDEPAHVWQSSSGTDDFEPKLSLTPLLVGTLKGTFYSLLLAIPLGILGAMYLSHFMHPAYKRYIKPVIEIMASLPSVVLGFLAGLWLAPRLEALMPALFLMLLVLPLVTLATGGLWSLLPRTLRNRVPTGTEMFFLAVAAALGIWLSIALEPLFESLVFGGDFQAWLREATGLPFDQRNAVVVGIAMGFAVIPIIFAISEDAFSNVPPNLVAGSLALGANRWQTVTRVVLPTASPGIFSAVMVGFGRAVGETMIVLMATGNTPIMDWNPFNGFRTLSANIAVEIPEAPQNGTLYRTLFLAALLLFVLTFVVNTVSELVRHRLRERYSKL